MTETAEAAKQVRYVGFWKRVLATVIDMVIIVVVLVLVALPYYGPEYFQLSAQGGTVAFDVVFQYVIPAVAAILFWRYRGATPGKMLVSAKIVDADTFGPPSTGKLIGRYFAYIVSMLPGLLLVVYIQSFRPDLALWLAVTPLLMWGFLWIAFDPRKQAWHDKLAGTVVIQEQGL
jgi:uncharacterized RDD family membrane protein YckC